MKGRRSGFARICGRVGRGAEEEERMGAGLRTGKAAPHVYALARAILAVDSFMGPTLFFEIVASSPIPGTRTAPPVVGL